MLKIKKMFKRCVCYIVVLALLFSSVPIYSASASETAYTKYHPEGGFEQWLEEKMREQD